MSARQFTTADGRTLKVITAEKYRDAPEAVTSLYAPKSRAGAALTARAAKLKETVLNHFNEDEVASAEALAVAHYKSHSEVLDKKALFNATTHLVNHGFLIREARGFYRLAPEGYVPPERVVVPRPAAQGKPKGKPSKADRQAKLAEAH